jgi:hypothetical protein
MTVPYTFANQTGPIPLLELDQNFAAVSLNVDTAVTVTGNAQPNITSVGILNSLSLNANSIALGANTVANTVLSTVSIGNNAGANNQSSHGIAIGFIAGRNNQGADAIAIGSSAGKESQSYGAIAIGLLAGNTSQNTNAVSIGQRAGFVGQGVGAVAIGILAGGNNQGANSVAIGSYAGNPFLGQNAICINGLSGNLNAPNANSLYIAPIRNSNSSVTNSLYYNTSTFEITYAPAANGSSYGNSDVSTFLADFGSNTVSTSGNISAGNITGLTSITLPVYAANVDRDTAIPTPTAGIMVLVANAFQGYNGSNWVTFTAS